MARIDAKAPASRIDCASDATQEKCITNAMLARTEHKRPTFFSAHALGWVMAVAGASGIACQKQQKQAQSAVLQQQVMQAGQQPLRLPAPRIDWSQVSTSADMQRLALAPYFGDVVRREPQFTVEQTLSVESSADKNRQRKYSRVLHFANFEAFSDKQTATGSASIERIATADALYIKSGAGEWIKSPRDTAYIEQSLSEVTENLLQFTSVSGGSWTVTPDATAEATVKRFRVVGSLPEQPRKLDVVRAGQGLVAAVWAEDLSRAELEGHCEFDAKSGALLSYSINMKGTLHTLARRNEDKSPTSQPVAAAADVDTPSTVTVALAYTWKLTPGAVSAPEPPSSFVVPTGYQRPVIDPLFFWTGKKAAVSADDSDEE